MSAGKTMSDDELRILLVEDSPTDADLIRSYLNRGLKTPFSCECVDHLATALTRLERRKTSIVLLDLNLPDSSGIPTFLRLREKVGPVPVVVLSGLDDVELALQAVREGAQDYVVKGRFDNNSLERSVRFAVERGARLVAETRLHAAKEELRVARELQQRLYPKTFPEFAGFDIAGTTFTSGQACADYYDFVPMPNNTVGIVVGDVSGRGFPAALVMVEIRSHLRALSQIDVPVEEVLDHVNALLLRDYDGQFFVSLFFGHLHPQTRSFVYSAGGQSGYLFTSQGEVRLLNGTSLPLGVQDEWSGSCPPMIVLHSGDLILVATNGITTAASAAGELFGEERVFEVVGKDRDASAVEIIQDLCHSARSFTGDRTLFDDLSAVAIKVL